jgi:hypothetical protein
LPPIGGTSPYRKGTIMSSIGPKFYFDVTRIGDDGIGDIYGVYVHGRPPLSGGGGTRIGRVWRQGDYGWVASGEAHPEDGRDSWHAEVARSVRHFASRKDACVFLFGMFAGTRRDARRAALASLPPF